MADEASAGAAGASGAGGGEDSLGARELESAKNTPALEAQHREVTKGKVRTRFPPEPNGYLHIGHAKSMHMNFHLAFEKLGVPEAMRETVFRYDDTNPEAESQEYIDSLREDVEWLGWTPVQTTFTSDYFDKLYELAVQLIRDGKAYVCHQTGEEISKSRGIAKEKAANPDFEGDPNSPWRDRPVEESLNVWKEGGREKEEGFFLCLVDCLVYVCVCVFVSSFRQPLLVSDSFFLHPSLPPSLPPLPQLFDDMRLGKIKENTATLRLKMDMTSPNFNMYDQVAYRIKFIPHPHAGDKWVIYPTYDYTHCIIDSLEHIDYSICTLEFETRRESYYWVLEALQLYRPKVYEFSRLNITYTVLSKRKLLKLVKGNQVQGWDDPRMPTIKGLRRRGYTADILNAFCKDIGVTRNENIIQYERLQHWARTILNETASRTMGVLDPILLTITNLPSPLPLEASDFPFAPERGTHPLLLTPQVYIDSSDFRQEDSKDYFGLAPGKSAILKYAFPVRVDEVILNEEGKVVELKATADREGSGPKPKGAITWVSAEEGKSVPTEFRLYNHLFTVESPGDETWEKELNPLSLERREGGRVDVSVLKGGEMPPVFSTFQLERVGYFTVDPDSTKEKLVLNRVVTLKEGGVKKEEGEGGGDGGKGKSRKEEQARQLAEKEARKNLDPKEMFKVEGESEKYGGFDEDGVPTKDAQDEVLSKSLVKKLKKEWEKQKRLFESNQK